MIMTVELKQSRMMALQDGGQVIQYV